MTVAEARALADDIARVLDSISELVDAERPARALIKAVHALSDQNERLRVAIEYVLADVEIDARTAHVLQAALFVGTICDCAICARCRVVVWRNCPTCGGNGVIVKVNDTSTSQCPACRGTGHKENG